MGGTAGRQRKAVVGKWQRLAQDMPRGSHRCRCWGSPRSNALLAGTKTLSGDVQTLAAGNGLQLAFIAICHTV